LQNEGAELGVKIKHIAITAKDTRKVADFYRDVLGLEEVGTHPLGVVFLSDGDFSVAIIPLKEAGDADVGPFEPHYAGLHHFGVRVDDVHDMAAHLDANGVKMLTDRGLLDTAGGAQQAEIKWEGPDGVVFDITQVGWPGT
jgi:catechol 2,3-dioxygenase-like lactoylglutathione lyase family enzyme